VNSSIYAGDLDRLATILVRNDWVEADYGTREATWAELATVWAQIIEITPNRADQLTGQVSTMRRPATVRIRWRSDVTQENRVRIDGVEMRITGGPAMIGRRVGLEMTVEALSTEGQAP
jgi:SPP1 family predicted phage head-tail adaptor